MATSTGAASSLSSPGSWLAGRSRMDWFRRCRDRFRRDCWVERTSAGCSELLLPAVCTWLSVNEPSAHPLSLPAAPAADWSDAQNRAWATRPCPGPAFGRLVIVPANAGKLPYSVVPINASPATVRSSTPVTELARTGPGLSVQADMLVSHVILVHTLRDLSLIVRKTLP